MRMLCDRLSALTAGAMVGVWYAKNFPCEKSQGGGDHGKAKDKSKDKGKEKVTRKHSSRQRQNSNVDDAIGMKRESLTK
ncbi:uncharacterized protein [Drosophila takahashii]|uniref:uncharacterized protein n=1 Tax=Drosophila takahashii TaxID=29030 RepID=UPI0038995018